MFRFLGLAGLCVVLSTTATAGPASGRITWVGAVVTPTCVVTTMQPVDRQRHAGPGLHTCVFMHNGKSMPIASYTRTVALLTSSRDALLRALARRMPAAQRSRATVLTRIYQ